MEPQPGVKVMQRLHEQCTRLKYASEETNFTLAFAELARRLRRRAVVVVMTDFVDPTGASLMVEQVGWLAKRHLVIFVALRDPLLGELSAASPGSLTALNEAVVAGELRREREVVLRKLRRQGVFCVDGSPSEVSVELINRYLEVHRRELL